MIDPLVVIVGPPGVGKTAVRRRLSAGIGGLSTGPDETSWPLIGLLVDRLSGIGVVEACRLPRDFRRRLASRQTLIVELTADPSIRKGRLLGRGESTKRTAELLAEDGLGIGYEDSVSADLVMATDDVGPARVADAIQTALGGG